jgi:hypothetical protein
MPTAGGKIALKPAMAPSALNHLWQGPVFEHQGKKKKRFIPAKEEQRPDQHNDAVELRRPYHLHAVYEMLMREKNIALSQ